jgi:hypothetical protein
MPASAVVATAKTMIAVNVDNKNLCFIFNSPKNTVWGNRLATIAISLLMVGIGQNLSNQHLATKKSGYIFCSVYRGMEYRMSCAICEHATHSTPAIQTDRAV